LRVFSDDKLLMLVGDIGCISYVKGWICQLCLRFSALSNRIQRKARYVCNAKNATDVA